MPAVQFWRAGAILLIVGGALTAGVWMLELVASPFSTLRLVVDPLTSVVGAFGYLALGIGLVFAGVGIRRRYPACWLLMVAGGAWLLFGVVVLSSSVFPGYPAWVFVAMLILIAVTLVAAATGVLRSGRLAGAARWILVLPAAWAVVTAITHAAELSWAMPWVLLVSYLLPIVVGIVWLRVRAAPVPHPVSAPRS